MTKRTKKSKAPSTIVVIIAVIIALVTAIQQNRQQTSTTTSATVGPITQILMITATAAPKTSIPATVSLSTDVPLSTRQPIIIATDIPGLQVTPMNGVIYDVIGSTNALGCPNSRCKVIEAYTKDNILIVTGAVIGTTYKDKKTKVWYQVIAHDGRKVYVHEAFVKPHES